MDPTRINHGFEVACLIWELQQARFQINRWIDALLADIDYPLFHLGYHVVIYADDVAGLVMYTQHQAPALTVSKGGDFMRHLVFVRAENTLAVTHDGFELDTGVLSQADSICFFA